MGLGKYSPNDAINGDMGWKYKFVIYFQPFVKTFYFASLLYIYQIKNLLTPQAERQLRRYVLVFLPLIQQ
jgi:hypothetical protein